MKLKFKPEDFEVEKLNATDPYLINGWCAEAANAKLKKWLDSALTVYAHNDHLQIFGTVYTHGLDPDSEKCLGLKRTHKAKLVEIEEIK